MHTVSSRAIAGMLAVLAVAGGCGLIPDIRCNTPLHNPFPQLKRVAVLPFFNQSSEPTLDGEAVAEGYYAALQAVPGFEVLPVGVSRNVYQRFSEVYGEPQSGEDFQRLAQALGVEAVVVGSVTDFSPYYPPRMALTTNWYAANPGYHPIPPGYGMPWGTSAEKKIPRRITQETEFELARSQLATQVPQPPPAAADHLQVAHQVPSELHGEDESSLPAASVMPPAGPAAGIVGSGAVLPPDWPSPLGLIPDGPSAPPQWLPQHEPVLSHTRIYSGDDAYVTYRLEQFVGNRDDARTGGWQNYLRRSDDFIRFCCRLHISEMLESRGGTDQSDLILRWPISRY